MSAHPLFEALKPVGESLLKSKGVPFQHRHGRARGYPFSVCMTCGGVPFQHMHDMQAGVPFQHLAVLSGQRSGIAGRLDGSTSIPPTRPLSRSPGCTAKTLANVPFTAFLRLSVSV